MTGATTQQGRKIKPPTTIHDDAAPSESCANDAERLFRLIEDERHLSALDLYHSIQERLNTAENAAASQNSAGGGRFRLRKQAKKKGNQDEQEDHEKARALLERHQEDLKDLEHRCKLFEMAKQNLNVDDDWTVAQTLFGITTFYRREADGSLSIKLEGPISGVPLFDQVAVLREIDLHSKWAPFCSSSLTVEHLDKLDTVGWFMVGLPHFGIMRDGAFRAIGCDSIYEDGSVLLVAQGIKDTPDDGADNKHLEPNASGTPQSTPTASTRESLDNRNSSGLIGDDEEAKHLFDFLSKDPILDTMDIPAPPTRMGSGRMTIRTFQALIIIESPTDATTKLVTNIDPNLPLIPQSLIDFLMKRLCGVLLSKMQHAAKKVSKDPVTNPHAVKMREERDFYEGWLLPKFQGVCKLHGWDMPPVTAFELTEAQADLASALIKKRKTKTTKKTMKHARTMSDDHLCDYLEGREDRSIAGSEPASIGEDCGPNLRLNSVGSDDLSELSRNSSSTASIFRNNPISAYLREIEERTQMRKDKEVEKSRQKAANRLKPKELDEESRSRLDKLRMARNRRLSNAKIAKSDEDGITSRSVNAETPKKSKRSWAVFWTKHGLITRLFVISALTYSLFYLLFLDTAFDRFVALHEDESFWKSRERDATTIAYLGVSGLLHFFLCYVLLMYAFSSVQLGAIAGKQAKEFYSQNIHLVLAIASASLIVLGMLASSFYATVQWVIWKAHLVHQSTGSMLPAVPAVPDAVMLPFNLVYGTMATILLWAQYLVFESNFMGRGILSLFGVCWGFVQNGTDKWYSFVEKSIAIHDGTAAYIPWREEAFIATRALFSYSATFLLVLLFLFILSAKKARRSGARSEAPTSKKSDADNGSQSTSSSKSNPKHQRTRSSTQVFDTIEEDKALETPAESGSSGVNGKRFRGKKAQYSSSK